MDRALDVTYAAGESGASLPTGTWKAMHDGPSSPGRRSAAQEGMHYPVGHVEAAG